MITFQQDANVVIHDAVSPDVPWVKLAFVLDADAFRRALWVASFGAFVDYQHQLAHASLRDSVERTERRLFGYDGAHRGED